MTVNGESSAEIERDAESERAGLVSTLDQLRENLKPGNVVDEVMAGAKINMSDLSDRVWQTARNNPIPSVLIGLGAAMLMGVGQKIRGHERTDVDDWSNRARDRDFDRDSTTGGNLRNASPPYNTSTIKERLSSNLDRVGKRASQAATRIADGASDLRQQAQRSVTNVTNYAASAREGISSVSGGTAMNQYSRSRDQVTSSISKLLDEQPLVLAALGIAVGAAIGAAIPASETEGQWMGEASGQVKQAARDLARDQFDQLKQTAGQTLEEVKRSAADHGLSADNLSDLVHDVGGKVQTGAYQAGSQVADKAPIRS